MKLIACALLSIISLFPLAAQSPVPVGSEPRHHLKYENDYVRIFDVIVPPNDSTLFHIHSNDYAYISIGDANLKAEVMGNQPVDLLLKDREVRFTKGPVTHRVTNLGSTPFRNITIEILSSPGTKGDAKHPHSIPGHTLVLENDRVRVERVMLEPGQSTGMHEHTRSGLGVVVSDGQILIESPGQKPQKIDLRPGEFQWHTGAMTHKITNIGKTKVEAVDLEWK